VLLKDTAARYQTAVLNFPRSEATGVRTLWHDGTRLIYRLDGVEKDSAVAPLGAMSTLFPRIGFADGERYGGDMRELLLFSRAQPLGITEIQGLETYARAKHGTPGG
jgi:hypothetical protein